MLSRIAESLFWIGRYVERADDTARILDVHTQRLVEDPWIDEDAACRSCSRSWARPPPQDRRLTTGDVLGRCSAFDRDQPELDRRRARRRPGRTPAAPAR